MKLLKKLYAVLEILVGMIAFLGVFGLFFPRLFHINPYIVLSGSMEPEIGTGSVVYIDKNIEIQSLFEQDVIGYRTSDNTKIVHRVISIDWKNRSVITKGDANNTEDLYPVPFEKIEGRALYSVPYMGYIIAWMQSGAGIGTIAVISIFFITGGFIQAIWDGEKRIEKKEKRSQREV